MAPPNASGYVVPNPRIPSTLGTLHILIGALMIVASLGMIVWELLSPALTAWMVQQNQEPVAKARAERESRIAALKTQEAAEKSTAKRDQLKAERAMLEDEAERERAASDPDGAKKPLWESVYFWTREASGLVLNVLMIVAGAGLLALRHWGRSLALWIAGLKLARLFVLTALSMMVLIPDQVQKVQATALRSFSQGPGFAMPGGARGWATMIAQTTAVSSSLGSVAYWLFGSLFPALTLWLLNKRSVQAAFIAAYIPPKPNARERPT